MKIDILKHTLVNVKKSVTFGMGKVEKNFFSKILDNLLEYKKNNKRENDLEIVDDQIIMKELSLMPMQDRLSGNGIILIKKK